MEKKEVNKKKHKRYRILLASLLGSSMLSLTSCFPNSILTQFAWIGALFNADPTSFQLLNDPSQGLGTNIVLDDKKNNLSLSDVVDSKVRTMNRRVFSYDYFELINHKSEEYGSYFSSEDFKENTNHTILKDEKAEELKKDPSIVSIFYKQKDYDGDIEGYVPAFIKVKDDWKNKYNEKYYSWFLNKVSEEQDNYLATYQNEEVLGNRGVEVGTANEYVDSGSCKIVDVSKNKNLVPFKFGVSFFSNSNPNWIPYDEEFWNKFLVIGNDSVSGEMAKIHFVDLDIKDFTGNTMPYDTYIGQFIFTAKENIVINSISFDLEVKTVDNYTDEDRLEDLTDTSMFGNNHFESDNSFSLDTGIYRLDQGDNFYNYAKKFNGSLIANWLRRKEYFTISYWKTAGTAYSKNYFFDGQDRLTGYYDNPEDVVDFTFKEGKKYHLSLDYSDSTYKFDGYTLKAVVNKGETFAINLNLDDSQLHNMFKINNLNIDFDVFSSYDAPVWYTNPGFSPNTNRINGSY